MKLIREVKARSIPFSAMQLYFPASDLEILENVKFSSRDSAYWFGVTLYHCDVIFGLGSGLAAITLR